MKKFSQACENNKSFIAMQIAEALSVQKEAIDHANSETIATKKNYILEIGSGTGQHAAFLTKMLRGIVWQPSDLTENLASIKAWRDELSDADKQRCLEPLPLDVSQESWPVKIAANVFTANTLHILAWPLVEQMIHGVAKRLVEQGLFFIYGPFNYAQQYTSMSNVQFDEWLKARDARSGIRDFELVEITAEEAGLALIDDIAMPANNRFLIWQKK